jgi:adenylate cyclase
LSQGSRRLAAIMLTDMVGYTALGQRDEQLSIALVEKQRTIIRPIFDKHGGREVKTIGDAFLVEFESALEAVRCAYEIQRSLHELGSESPVENKIALRIGVHIGDVIHDQGDILGDAVNVTSRIEPLAAPGGVCVSEQVYDQVKNKFEFPLQSIGIKELKNVGEAIEVFRVLLPWESETGPAGAFDKSRLAVLPFVNLSTDPGDAFFADGVAEEIISAVSGISGLSVISRTSVMGYKGTTKKVKEIGKELEVGSILEGSFRKAGNMVRITVQLVEVEGDKHLWAQNYDRELKDVFAVQTDIAKQVAEALAVKILPVDQTHLDKTPTKSAEAHSSYLKGRYHWNKRSEENLSMAVTEYQDAIKVDPGYALAYSGLADCYLVMGSYGFMPQQEALERSNEYALKAVRADDSSAEAHTSLGMSLGSSFHLAEAEKEFRRAIQLNPNYSTAHHWYGLCLLQTRRFDEALREALLAEYLDPLSPIISVFLAECYHSLGRLDSAEEKARRAVELNNDFSPGYEALHRIHRSQRRYEDCSKDIENLRRLGAEPDFLACLRAMLEAEQGRPDDARALLKRLEEKYTPEKLLQIPYIGVCAVLGEREKAVGMVLVAAEHKSDILGLVSYMSYFDDLRADPRVQDALKKLGLARSP